MTVRYYASTILPTSINRVTRFETDPSSFHRMPERGQTVEHNKGVTVVTRTDGRTTVEKHIAA